MVYGSSARSPTSKRLCPPQPMIVPLLVGGLISSSYVAAIKIAVPENVSVRERNHPVVIGFRVRRILALCLCLLLAVPFFSVRYYGNSSIGGAIREMGLVPGLTSSFDFETDLRNIGVAWAKIIALYMGPIVAYIYADADWRADFKDSFCTLAGIRDHVFAPVTEELVYRAALVAVLSPVLSRKSLIVYSPLLFGLAHVHHGFTLYHQENFPLVSAVAAAGFQLIYTTLFGILANHFYVDSGCNLWCPIVVHATCNLLGFPSFAVRDTHPRFFYVYCLLLVAGIVTFWKVL